VEEADKRRNEPQCRVRSVQLPVGDRAWIDAEPLGNLALKQAQVEPPLAQVITKIAESP
jgi:hypothetical protein